jgi:hypothetical protein
MISYSHRDTVFARKFVRAMNNDAPDIKVWIDDSSFAQEGKIEVGNDWRNDIAEVNWSYS